MPHIVKQFKTVSHAALTQTYFHYDCCFSCSEKTKESGFDVFQENETFLVKRFPYHQLPKMMRHSLANSSPLLDRISKKIICKCGKLNIGFLAIFFRLELILKLTLRRSVWKIQEYSNVRAPHIFEGKFLVSVLNSRTIFEHDLLSSDSVTKSATEKPWVSETEIKNI